MSLFASFVKRNVHYDCFHWYTREINVKSEQIRTQISLHKRYMRTLWRIDITCETSAWLVYLCPEPMFLVANKIRILPPFIRLIEG